MQLLKVVYCAQQLEYYLMWPSYTIMIIFLLGLLLV